MFHIGIATQAPPLPEHGELSELGIEFIESCLTLDPPSRPTAEQLLTHPWLENTIRLYVSAEMKEASLIHRRLNKPWEWTPTMEVAIVTRPRWWTRTRLMLLKWLR